MNTFKFLLSIIIYIITILFLVIGGFKFQRMMLGIDELNANFEKLEIKVDSLGNK